MKIGLMLGGGGAKGAYQVGVLKAFEEAGLLKSIKYISGTSIGALNSYFYLSSKGTEEVIEAWEYAIENNPFKLDFKSEQSIKDKAIKSINKMASKYTNVEKFKASSTNLFITVTKLEEATLSKLLKRWSWESQIIHLNKVENPLDYVISSATIPIILGYSEVEDQTFVDGGLTNNNPIEPLIEAGCQLIFILSLDYFYSIDKIKVEDVTLINLTSRLGLSTNPIKSYLSIIDFSKEAIHRRINCGYFVAKKMIEYIMEIGILFKKDNNYYLNDLTNSVKRINIPKYIEVEAKNICSTDEGE